MKYSSYAANYGNDFKLQMKHSSEPLTSGNECKNSCKSELRLLSWVNLTSRASLLMLVLRLQFNLPLITDMQNCMQK